MSWEETRLGDLVEITHGWAFKSEYFSIESSGLPVVVNIGNFRYEGGFRFDETLVKRYSSDYPKEYALLAGDILLAMTCQTPGGEILGIPAKVPANGETYLHNQRLGKAVVKHESKVSSNYLYWLFLWREFNHELCATATGTKILHTAPRRIENFKFRRPPLDEQLRIAEVLDALDEKIELNRKQNRTLEAIAQALFKRWFVEFEFPDENGQPYKSSGGAMQFSELGEIPVGWEVRPLSEITNYLSRGLTPVYIEEGGVSVLNQRCIRDGWISSAPARRHDSNVRKTDGRELCVSDVLVNSTGVGTLGRVAQVVMLNEPTVVDSHVTVVRPDIEKISREYLGVNIRLREREIEYMAEGSTGQTELSRTKLEELPIIIPDSIRQNLFADVASSINAKRVRNWQESIALASIRDTLLPKIMSGELQVGELESDMEIAV